MRRAEKECLRRTLDAPSLADRRSVERGASRSAPRRGQVRSSSLPLRSGRERLVIRRRQVPTELPLQIWHGNPRLPKEPNYAPRMPDPFEEALDELDNQEIHIRRLARRIDMGSRPFGRIELSLSERMHAALAFAHQESEWRPDDDRPDRAHLMVARAKAQALAIRRLADELQSFGAPIDPQAIEAELERAREGMAHRLEIWINSSPVEVDRVVVAKDYYELIFNPQQDALLKIDFAMDEIERRAK